MTYMGVEAEDVDEWDLMAQFENMFTFIEAALSVNDNQTQPQQEDGEAAVEVNFDCL